MIWVPFVKLIRQWPQITLNESTYAWTGQYQFDKQQWPDAALALQALLDHVPDYPDRPRVALKVAECAERAEQVDDAYAKYEALAAAAPESPVAAEARFRQAAILEKKTETDRAVELYLKAADVSANPENEP